ncbi:MAG: HAD hydrolase family protein [Chitinophagales bacterium]|nr:HAD hydrolase family protein [Chitinophagales bacterium]
MSTEKNYLSRLKDITTFVLDVDGVLTDGSLLATEQGELLRTFNAKDGFALFTALQQKFNICIITGGNSKAVYERFKQLGIKHIYYKIHNKKEVLENYMLETNTTVNQLLYVADDIPDIPAMKMCAIKCCPKDAVPEVQQIADYIATKNGGDGCVREIIEMVLKVQDKWFKF